MSIQLYVLEEFPLEDDEDDSFEDDSDAVEADSFDEDDDIDTAIGDIPIVNNILLKNNKIINLENIMFLYNYQENTERFINEGYTYNI